MMFRDIFSIESHHSFFIKPEDEFEKNSETSYNSYNITPRHNSKELQQQFHCDESFRSHAF